MMQFQQLGGKVPHREDEAAVQRCGCGAAEEIRASLISAAAAAEAAAEHEKGHQLEDL